MIKPLLLRSFLTILLSLPAVFLVNAQTTQREIYNNLTNDERVAYFTMDPMRETPSLIKMKESGESLSVQDAPEFLRSVLGTEQETEFVNEKTTNSHGLQVDLFQQYTNGIKVEHGVFKAISKEGSILAFTAEYYNLPSSINSVPTLSEEAALESALNHVGAEQYAWEYIETLGDSPEIAAAYQHYYPKGELVFVDNYSTTEVDLSLAYRFNIYAAEPISRADIYVDAQSGTILLVDAIIKHAEGIDPKAELKKSVRQAGTTPRPLAFLSASGDTRYAGSRSFNTSTDADGNFVLNGMTAGGIENETRSYEGQGGLPLSIPALASLSEAIIDGDGDLLHPETADNLWTAGEHRKDEFSTTNIYPIANEKNNDDVALDAHWGAEIVLDYWKNVHNRDSYDDNGTKVLNFVHYGDGYDNAFWNGSSMTYGDGSYQGGTNPDGAFAPLTSMDVCSHEIGHGVCEFTANLVYQKESGAMNEGFSDIWAAAVEYYVLAEIDGSLNYDPWGIGEQIDERDGGLAPGDANSQALRWMDDPKAAGDPDSYGGENWINPDCDPTLVNDYCGVHTNSGVLNKWYYFLVSGSGQSFSPGAGKQSQDDQVTDAGNSYTVEGLGFDKASQITYIAETMLSPNATFAQMRATSILVAQTLYGISSFEEEQTTNAWYAVDIGEAFNAGDPNSVRFSNSNVTIYSENNLLDGCEDFNTYEVVVEGIQVEPTANINISLAGSTATLGEDFDISTTELSFSGSEVKKIGITVYDDAVIEDTENIVLSFVHNGEFHRQEFSVSNNDFEPRTGSERFNLLGTEQFSSGGLPAGWSTVSLSDGVNHWQVNGSLTAAGKAYITDGTADVPFYDQLSGTNTILRTPLINAAGSTEVRVSFDWEVGGETDVDPTVLYDYGEFVYSLDGVNYISVQKFVGDALGAAPASGTLTLLLSELDGQAFYLGWRWFNDTLVGTEFSFTIDNVTVSAVPAGIEDQQGEQATAQVHTGNRVYFLSDTDKGLIARIENASEDLGCVTVSVIEAGSGFEVFSNIPTARPSKAYSIQTENNEASYDLTLYFTNEELSSFASPAELIPFKVNSPNIDDASEQKGNFDLDGALTEENSEDGYRAYTGTFKGSGTVSIVKDFNYCMVAPEPWTSSKIGDLEAGEVCYDNGIFEITASGSGISEKSDSFQFLYQEIAGNGEVSGRLDALDSEANQALAGVMIRGSLEATASFAMTSVTANPSGTGPAANFSYRKTSGANGTRTADVSVDIPQYFKIVRNGKEISAYISPTGETWHLLGQIKLNLGQTIYVGLVTTSSSTATATATFSDVKVLQDASITAKSAEVKNQEVKDNLLDSTEFSIYPNPAARTLNLAVTNSGIQSIAVYDLLGKKIRTYPAPNRSGQVGIDVTDLFRGIYIVKVQTTDGHTYNARFYKE